MNIKLFLLPVFLAALPMTAVAGMLTGVQGHVEGNVSLVNLAGGPPITDSFSLDGPALPQPLAGDAFADSIIPSNATVQAIVSPDSLAVVSEAANLAGIESPITSGTASLQGDVVAGSWVLNVTTEHIALLAGIDITVDAEIAYTITSAAGTLVDETVTFSGFSDSFDITQYTFSIADGDTGLLSASIVADTASSNVGTGLALTLVQFDLAPVAVIDADGDGVTDTADNCTQVANAGQQDTDGDNYGNACDSDLNNDCIVNFLDLWVLRQVFFTNDPDADFNSDGTVNFVDLQVTRNTMWGPPGPSGITNDCD